MFGLALTAKWLGFVELDHWDMGLLFVFVKKAHLKHIQSQTHLLRICSNGVPTSGDYFGQSQSGVREARLIVLMTVFRYHSGHFFSSRKLRCRHISSKIEESHLVECYLWV